MKLTRNAAAVCSHLVKRDHKVFTKVPLEVQIPQRFEQIDLAQIGMETFIYGLFPVILESGEYSICNLMGLVKINPDQVTTIKVKDEGYYSFKFDAGSTLIDNTSILKRDNLLYIVLKEIIFQGNVPWYVNYEDLAKIFDTAKHFADNDAGKSYEVNELIASMISRSRKDRSLYYRLSEHPEEKNPDYVALTSIFYSIKNTVNKLAGNYFADGLVSALVDPSQKTERIEQLLRT